ncbi:MAG: NAD(P)H-dependent glycerol-3-phosphate dehydrogenase [Bulleidia sp.]
MKIRVLGTGSWGSALAQVLADNGQDVVMWGIDEGEVNDIENNHHNSKYFEAEINHDVHATTDLACVKDADVLLVAVPVLALESVVNQIAPLLDHPVIFINVAKGFHPTTHERLSVVMERLIPQSMRKAIVSLIGPSHAEEVIIRLLTSVNAVCEDEEQAKVVQELFSNAYFRVYTNTDVIGAEIGVALKNVMAIASGILEGVGQGDNARAALMTRGLAEMTRYGVAHGGKKETFLGLDGVGDLIVTCTSMHSRNFTAGLQIGKDGSAEGFWKENRRTVEGVNACKVVYEQAKKEGIEMPIVNEVYRVLYENKKPSDAIADLMGRSLKPEI